MCGKRLRAVRSAWADEKKPSQPASPLSGSDDITETQLRASLSILDAMRQALLKLRGNVPAMLPTLASLNVPEAVRRVSTGKANHSQFPFLTGTNTVEALSFPANPSTNTRDASVSYRGIASGRSLVWVIVVLAHAGLIAAMLLSRPRLSRERRSPVDSLSLQLLPNDSAKIGAPRFTVHIDSGASLPSIVADLTLPSIPIDNNVITLSAPQQQQQRIDWDRESALAVQSSIARATKEEKYRDLSSLTPEQLDWIKKNHMEPMQGFQWDRASRREMLRYGIVKLNDYCVLIVVIPFCRFGGKIQYSSDLFEHMRDPKPLDQ
jgi:hypothetical protein